MTAPQLSLLPDATAPAKAARAEKTQQPPDFFNLAVRQLCGAAEGWEWFSAEAVPPDAILLEGGVPVKITRTGRRHWKSGTGDRYVVTRAQVAAVEAEWEARTGKCRQCGGDGLEHHGWARTDGARYRECTRCLGTGAAPRPLATDGAA